jgi:CubicO group peptidase (beta-lactamase class C family)
MHIIKIRLIWILFLICNISITFAQESGNVKKPKTLIELQESIQEVLKETNTAGAGIVMINGDSVIWIGGLGNADIEKNIKVNENTIFRLGSISKMMVSLAILKLQEEGKLNLNDRIRNIIPEIEFDNPWEDTHPIRIENLLEHTSGWSYWHLAELGSDDPKPKTLKEALDFYPKSRKCLYVPGTRMNESNVGTAVAAYIVEKVSKMSFEDYMDKFFFRPMGIENMTFYNTKQYKISGASLYENGIKLNYFNILYRPAAALNASPKDMAKMVEFFINHGEINGIRILSDSSLKRMERSGSMGELSKSEMFKGFGLSNMVSYYKGFMYQGFAGSLPGGNATIEYLPEYNLGFAVMINDGNEDALYKIAYLIKNYQTKDFKQRPVKVDNKKYSITTNPSGYYTSINAKIDKIEFIERIKNIQKVWVKNDTLFTKYMLRGNSTIKYVPTCNNEFRYAGYDIVGLSIINDPLDGQIIVSNGILKKISTFWAYSLLTLFYSFFLILFTTIIFGLIWVLVYFLRGKKNKIALKICSWPLITSSIIFIVYFIILMNSRTRYDWFRLFGTANIYSVLLLLCSICYALASVWTVYYIFKNRHETMSKFFYFHSAFAAILNFVFMLYFLSNGLIGIPTWV